MNRKLLPYEYNFLLKNNIDLSSLNQYGQMPVEYIVEKCEFYNRDLYVNQNVLIPRIETEEIVELFFLNNKKKSYSCADVGTGSGAIGITIFLESKKLNLDCEMILSDISDDALLVCRKNVDKYCNNCNLINIIKSDLLENINIKLDYIISNLPYIPSSRIPLLDESVRDYEPVIALDGGPNGLRYIYNLIENSKYNLKEDGIIFLEIDESHSYKDFAMYKEIFNIEIKKDKFGLNRFCILKKN